MSAVWAKGVVNSTLSQTLADTEFDQLNEFLARFRSERAMNLEMSDGFFAALHFAPQMSPPSAFLPELWGGGEMSDDEAFSHQEHKEFMELVLRHWNDVLRRLSDDEVFLPVLYSDEQECFTGNDWAQGFVRGMDYHSADWSEILDEEQFGALIPILALFHEHDPDPSLRPEPFSAAQREELLIGLAAGAMRVYRHLEPHRKMAARLVKEQSTIRRTSPKLGRNAPCPCGSGKKYKKCCGKVTLH